MVLGVCRDLEGKKVLNVTEYDEIFHDLISSLKGDSKHGTHFFFFPLFTFVFLVTDINLIGFSVKLDLSIKNTVFAVSKVLKSAQAQDRDAVIIIFLFSFLFFSFVFFFFFSSSSFFPFSSSHRNVIKRKKKKIKI